MFGSGIVLDNVSSATLIGNKAGPCPNCGSMGTIPDGLYDTTRLTIRILATSASSVESLRRLQAILQGLNRPGVTGQAVAAAIREQAPEFKELAPVAQQSRGFDVAAWILVAIATITLLLQIWDRFDPGTKGATKEQIEEIYQRVLHQSPTAQSTRPVPVSSAKGPGRNAPCPCGSGKKYKRCHGSVQAGAPRSSSR